MAGESIEPVCSTSEGRYNLAPKWAEDGKKLLQKASLSRDLVSRRGVTGVATVAHMLGLENADSMSEEDIKEALKEKINSGKPVTMMEKGFFSTSVKTTGYSAGNSYNLGVEFIILCKKGTKGINYTKLGSKGDERELMLCPGTKFEVVNSYFNDGTPDHDERKICEGNKKSWKIYLKTVVDDEENQNA